MAQQHALPKLGEECRRLDGIGESVLAAWAADSPLRGGVRLPRLGSGRQCRKTGNSAMNDAEGGSDGRALLKKTAEKKM
ncbi:hypothetical protein [Candidatus Nitrotoga sp. 1052]|uniref:hypothetical protein n=1 Tax=Candidatus Nitrotoga sp. 1052 TaxID=2886964 RepID=UPI001EF3E102|nr:hypothetical protein [Candidatus Nitrotoga sp. 1052]